ncbi:hypothetical protein SS1G_03616 [Sclerotinia sclerotiorum 1980 UF-70]|uniref:FAD-binding PCMH-type domain-containing protein n=2 Tax=Sclerotinia sclerotiorum (strain ATCC 18683 / 1980 / Ss-1) TaxID=665079 RepID=A7EE76_SCLS1|nr:hypothetical protein SS1G_03616 [Sclerotinia sclerotiorum 1980 UF-70]APA10763.1 hypothetical protein sscle_07g055330 [Sclerotinia sclerotiorum 1980 UF-70]EDO01142.1 hypothetical protein SS1G_03616 [Sclerotinia sclerotiorum 1980 UF-70]
MATGEFTAKEIAIQDLENLVNTLGFSNCFKKGKGFYENEVTQYATSSYEYVRTLPALILKPRNKQDIATILEYATKRKIGVSVRTGGHQYSGASSCTAPNIQMDLSETFKGPDDRTLLRKQGRLHTSVSWSLKEFTDFCAENRIFAPHGQCIAVHLGGHVQTGGYGQLGRSFGLLADHVLEIDIVDYEGIPRRLVHDSPNEAERDLFNAILGGSPGNFGVVTHFTIKVHKDEDYEGSIGMKCLYPYSRDRAEKLLDLVAKMSDGLDSEGNEMVLARNYDVCLNVVSSGNEFAALFPGKAKSLRDFYNNHDDLPNIDPNLPQYPKLIYVWAQWVKLKDTDVFDEKLWFDKLSDGCIDSISINHKELMSYPMSYMTGSWWILDAVREYPYPYIKSTRMSDKTDLSKSGWPKWLAQRIDKIVAPENNGLFVCAQIQPFGGPESKTVKNANNGTSYSWRNSTITCTLDCFYNFKHDKKQEAEQWQKENEEGAIGENGVFSTKDMRPLWGSFGEYDFSKIWDAYHDSQEKYDKLRRLRKIHDPTGVFTPNTFCVPREGEDTKDLLAERVKQQALLS